MESAAGIRKSNLIRLAIMAVWIGAFTPPAAFAQGAVVSASPSSQWEAAGFDHFYSLEYDPAIENFQKLRDAQPSDPSAYNHLASGYFYRQLLLAGSLEGEFFTDRNLFSRLKKIQPDPLLKKKFWEANNTAIRLCDQRLKRNKSDQEALYHCGVSYSDRAAYLGLVERAKFETLASARKANAYHVQLQRLNPQFYDAYLVTGVYEYIMGSLPGSLKFLLFLAGFIGDQQRGIHSVEIAAQQGSRSRQDAKILLALIYRREKRYAESQRILSELAEAYPRNYIFPLEIASVYQKAGEEKEAVRTYEQMLDDAQRGKAGYAAAPIARVHYALGELYWKAGELEPEKLHFDQVRGAAGGSQELEIQNEAMQRQVEQALRERQHPTVVN